MGIRIQRGGNLDFAALGGNIGLAGVGGGENIGHSTGIKGLDVAAAANKPINRQRCRGMLIIGVAVDFGEAIPERDAADPQTTGDGKEALGQCQIVEKQIGDVVNAAGIGGGAYIHHHATAVARHPVGPVIRIAPGIAGEAADGAGLILLEAVRRHSGGLPQQVNVP